MPRKWTRRNSSVIRSFDGGQNWEVMPKPKAATKITVEFDQNGKPLVVLLEVK